MRQLTETNTTPRYTAPWWAPVRSSGTAHTAAAYSYRRMPPLYVLLLVPSLLAARASEAIVQLQDETTSSAISYSNGELTLRTPSAMLRLSSTNAAAANTVPCEGAQVEVSAAGICAPKAATVPSAYIDGLVDGRLAAKVAALDAQAASINASQQSAKASAVLAAMTTLGERIDVLAPLATSNAAGPDYYDNQDGGGGTYTKMATYLNYGATLHINNAVGGHRRFYAEPALELTPGMYMSSVTLVPHHTGEQISWTPSSGHNPDQTIPVNFAVAKDVFSDDMASVTNPAGATGNVANHIDIIPTMSINIANDKQRSRPKSFTGQFTISEEGYYFVGVFPNGWSGSHQVYVTRLEIMRVPDA